MTAFAPPVYSPSTKPFLFTPNGWDTVWKAAKANSGTTPCWMYFLGDSDMQGSVGTDFMNLSQWALVISRLLARGYTRYADFWSTAYSADFLTFSGGTFNGVPPWVINSTTSRGYLNWFNGRPLQYSASNAANPLATFTTPYACTAMDILHSPNAVGSWQYSVDGGGLVTVNTTATGAYTKVAITGLANTTHTVVIANAVNANACIIDGISTYRATTGIGFVHTAFGGNSAFNYINTGNQPQPRDFILQGREKSAGYVGNFGFPTQAHLWIVGLGLNDNSVQTAIDQYEYALASIVEGIRGGRANASILLVAQSNPDAIHSDVTSALSVSAPQYRHYLAVQERIAQEYNCGWLNIHAKWGNSGAALGYQTAGNMHPTDAGQADTATQIMAVI